MSSAERSLIKRPISRCCAPHYLLAAILIARMASGELQADPGYSAKSGKIAFSVSTNIPYLKVSGSSAVVKGGGEATVTGNAATIRNLSFEVDPKTLKTGMKLRDQHMYEKVFRASDGSTPRVVLRADQFEAKFNPQTSRWEGTLQAQLALRGVIKPVSFRAWGEKKDNGAIVNAQGTVKTSDFGVGKIGYSGATVNDAVVVTVSNLRIEP